MVFIRHGDTHSRLQPEVVSQKTRRSWLTAIGPVCGCLGRADMASWANDCVCEAMCLGRSMDCCVPGMFSSCF